MIISDVARGTPAEAAGLRVQDIIVSIVGKPADGLPSFATRLLTRRDGERIQLGVLRGFKKTLHRGSVLELVRDFDRLAGMVAPNRSLFSTLGFLAIQSDPNSACTGCRFQC